MRRLLAVVWTVTLVLTAGAFVSVSQGRATANDLSCGATITTDKTLHRDLVNCPNNGIVIGAGNITLDLNGHVIDGNGTPVGACPDVCDVGVDNSGGHSSLTVKGGSVRQFSVGVVVAGVVADTYLRGLAASGNTDFGIIIGESTKSEITNNSLRGNGISGLLMFDSRKGLVDRNLVSGSGGFGIFLSAVNGSRIENNALEGNEHGIALFDGSSRNKVLRNEVFHGVGSAIDVGNGLANRIIGNRMVDNGDGIIVVSAASAVLDRNIVTNTGVSTSPDESGGFSILLDGTRRTIVRRNKVTGGRGPAIWVTSLESANAAKRNVLSRNVVNRNRSDGILVDKGATGTSIDSNTANRNGKDGIDIDVPATTLTRNTANHNHELGIEAVLGVTDGGGNKATGNGNPLQCRNVDC